MTIHPQRYNHIVFSGAFLVLSFFVGLLVSPMAAAASALPTTLTLSAEGYVQTLSSDTLASWFHLETKLTADKRWESEAENTLFCPVDGPYCDISLSRAVRSRMKIHLESETDDAAIKSFVTGLSDAVNQDPVDAIFSANDAGQVIVAQSEKVGRTLRVDESVALISLALRQNDAPSVRVELPTDIAQPNIVGSDRERLGLHELIGIGHTNFKGSPKNRIYNITRALKQFQSAIIPPGEEFSFVKQLGEVDGEHGYLPELVIKDNKTTPEFGGGICQVSTTVFRAAIYSGMKITARRNHAYPVRYYTPYGMDATVYIPKPDLSFINNTPGYVLMQSTINGNDLTFSFYGTKDGRTISVDGPHILQSNPDGSMKTVFSQLVTDASGKDIINDSFWSNYKSPSLFPHPGQESVFTTKPAGWSNKQWQDYKKIHP